MKRLSVCFLGITQTSRPQTRQNTASTCAFSQDFLMLVYSTRKSMNLAFLSVFCNGMSFVWVITFDCVIKLIVGVKKSVHLDITRRSICSSCLKLPYFPAHKTHCGFFIRNFRINNDEFIFILVIYWKRTGLLHTKISNHNIIYSS